MEKPRFNTRLLAVAAIAGAAYAALTVALAPISYGPVQFRISEVLCILPYFIPSTAWGLYVGCLLANLFTGNIFDIILGSLATLLAGLLTARTGRKAHTPANSALACLTWAYGIREIESSAWLSFLINALWVGFGELVVLYVLGFPLMRWLPKQKFFRDFLKKVSGSDENNRE